MSKFNKTDVVQGGRCEIPTALYRVRCNKSKFGKSNSDNEMTTLSCEIVAPESINVNGIDYSIAGRDFQLFLMHVPDKSWGQAQVFEFCEKLGIDLADGYDTELHEQYFVGLEWDMILSSEEIIKRMPKQQGEKEGAPILDGLGNKISAGWQVRANLGDVPQHANPTRVDMGNRPY